MGETKRPVALVTGAGGAIGRDVCLRLTRQGACVLAIDIDPSALELTVRDAEQEGGKCVAREADVTDERQVEGYVTAALSAFGSVNWFANNAGIEGPAAPLSEFPSDGFRRVLEVNVMSVFFGMKHVIPVMRQQGGGRIVNTASVAGLYATPQLIAYGASKHAVIGMTRTAAVETAADGIAVNAICPGPQNSRMMDSIESSVAPADPEAARTEYLKTIPMGRYGEPGEVADIVAWLLTAAPPYMTGQNIVVDGGLLIS